MTAQPPAWAGSYIGIPFEDLGRTRSGCDCWGLVRLVLAERAGLSLRSFSSTNHIETRLGLEISSEWMKVDRERVFDAVEMSTPVRLTHGWDFPPLHVGIVVADGWILHTERATASLLARYREGFLKKRVLGFWRHERFVDAAA